MLSRKTLFLLLVLLYMIDASPRNPSPYQVLGVQKGASDADIRRSYRQKCLQFHPDKNVDKPLKERQRCEEAFKQVQKAYSEIGDAESRRNYDRMQAFEKHQSQYNYGSRSPNQGTRGASSAPPSAAAEAFYRSFYAQQSSGRTPFYFNGVDISNLFSTSNRPGLFNPGTVKSIYVQKVQVPLETLYTGAHGEFVLRDNLWKRYRAAFRGGVAVPVLYQALAVAVPLIRVISLPMSMLVGMAVFHMNLPKPTVMSYDVNIQSGWKSGTKLTFKEVDPGFDVIFVLEEGHHNRFVRVGNDLLTTLRVTKSEAEQGCSKKLKPLGKYDAPILVELRPHQVIRSGEQVKQKGLGWPQRKKNGIRGDLIVVIKIVPDKRQKRRRRSRRQNQAKE